jgi:hypothetical protein
MAAVGLLGGGGRGNQLAAPYTDIGAPRGIRIHDRSVRTDEAS